MKHIKKLLLVSLIALVPLIGYAHEQSQPTAATITAPEQKSVEKAYFESAAEAQIWLIAAQGFVRDAREHMPSNLQSALTRKDIENLLRVEEEACCSL